MEHPRRPGHLTALVIASLVVLVFGMPLVATAATERFDTEKSFPATPGGRVVVDASFHEVEVRVRPGDTVNIRVELEISASASKAKRLIEAYEPVFSTPGDDIKVRSTSNKSFGFSWGSTRNRGLIEVAMPPGMDLLVDVSSGSTHLHGDFGDAKVVCDASSGSINIEGAMRELEVDVSSGSIRAKLVRSVERVVADASSGSVNISGPASDVRIGTSSGSITADELVGDARLNASSGGIKASWERIPASAVVSADTSSGSVRLRFPHGTSLTGTVDTSSGGIHSDFPGKSSDRGHHLVLDGGDGAVRLEVDTSSGGVRLAEY